MSYLSRLWIVLCLLWGMPLLWGQTLSVQTTTSKKEITIGEKFSYVINVSYPKDMTIVRPSFRPEFGAFEVKSYRFEPPVLRGEIKIETLSYALTIYELGTFTIPSLTLRYYEGSDLKTTNTKEVTITVIPSAQEEDTLGDIKDLVPVGGQLDWEIVLPLLGAVLLIVAGLVYLIFLRKTGTRDRQPFEVATLSLQALLRSKIFDQHPKEFYYRFCEVVKTYLEQKHTFKATSMTTRQIEHILLQRQLPSHAFYLKVLPYADKVKFARFKAEPAASHAFIRDFKAILDDDKHQYLLYVKEQKKKQAFRLKPSLPDPK